MLGDTARQAAQDYIGDSSVLPRRCGKSSSILLTCILSPHFGNSSRVRLHPGFTFSMAHQGFQGDTWGIHTRLDLVFTFCGFTSYDDMTHSYRASSPRSLTHRTLVQRSYSRFNRLRSVQTTRSENVRFFQHIPVIVRSSPTALHSFLCSVCRLVLAHPTMQGYSKSTSTPI